ncbi:MAG: 2,3-bisphosphoglycerate-independent phosphoglycerate mutase [Burkholderiales bacterium]
MPVTPTLLLILDGFGCREEVQDNAIAQARKPNWDKLWGEFPHTTIDASGAAVGLPAEQMGNSEVGHLNMGAGRVVYQEFTRINNAIESGHFFTNPTLLHAIASARQYASTLHLLVLLSDGGVHSHESHLYAMLEMAANNGLRDVVLHLFLDGRDTPPKSAAASIHRLQEKCRALGVGKVVSMIGRYYAMDRDRRWERTRAAYDLVTSGKAPFRASSPMEGLERAYARGENDEFVQATVVATADEPARRMRDNDVVVFMNFRSDRARQLTRPLIEPGFDRFPRNSIPRLAEFATLTAYSYEFHIPAAFPPERVQNCFGEYISRLGLRQLRIAETEKYPHVTFFFNGGEERVFPGEERVLVPSPRVATYDLKPEMSAAEVTDKLVEAIKSRYYHSVICNYANADMVGHTGVFDAAVRAVETIDTCIGRAVQAMRECDGEVLITADHGNAEIMMDRKTQQPFTSHTSNVVPLLYVGRPARLAENGALQDIAPSLLKIMGLPQPVEMTGRPLIEFE